MLHFIFRVSLLFYSQSYHLYQCLSPSTAAGHKIFIDIASPVVRLVHTFHCFAGRWCRECRKESAKC